MLDIPAFVQETAHHKPSFAPLHCWDIANLDLERRIRIHNDMEQLKYLIAANNWQLDINHKALLADNYALVVTGLSKEIIWVSHHFQTMTGYKTEEVLGKRPSILQGERTNQQTRQLIHEKLARFENLEARILNYRKNGEAYWCSIKIFPIRNKENVITHYIAAEKEIN